MINEAELRQMTPAQRRELARLIAAMDYPHPLLDLKVDRRHKIGAAFFAVACLVLAAWIIVLVLTLHRHFTAHHWRLAWVGFDFAELIAFAVTGWAFWRGRQIVVAGLLVTATLLCCDAWFDVILDLGAPGMWISIALAVLLELPLAFLLLNAARRLLRMSALAAVGAGGVKGPLPSLWKLPLASVHMRGRRPEPPPGDRPEPPPGDRPARNKSPYLPFCRPGCERPRGSRARAAVVGFAHGHRFHRGNRR